MRTDVPELEYAIDLQTMRLELVDLLIRVAGDPLAAGILSLEQIAVHGMRLERARNALQLLQDYAAEIGGDD